MVPDVFPFVQSECRKIETVRISRCGNGQAVRLPEEFHLKIKIHQRRVVHVRNGVKGGHKCRICPPPGERKPVTEILRLRYPRSSTKPNSKPCRLFSELAVQRVLRRALSAGRRCSPASAFAPDA